MQSIWLLDASSDTSIWSAMKEILNFSNCFMSVGRYRYRKLSFGAAPASDMFQRKIDEIFKALTNVFGIAYGMLIVGYDNKETEHDYFLARHEVRFEKAESTHQHIISKF